MTPERVSCPHCPAQIAAAAKLPAHIQAMHPKEWAQIWRADERPRYEIFDRKKRQPIDPEAAGLRMEIAAARAESAARLAAKDREMRRQAAGFRAQLAAKDRRLTAASEEVARLALRIADLEAEHDETSFWNVVAPAGSERLLAKAARAVLSEPDAGTLSGQALSERIARRVPRARVGVLATSY